ncbi:MAG TPA: metal ABC transporter substrate-binding protein [Gemmatimonadales bacterium]|jgi:zinc/manganese transport system substrate-binding protein|nr:metal ABC transporter substrate-binding protein [Gemmatimonadales bacterium]
MLIALIAAALTSTAPGGPPAAPAAEAAPLKIVTSLTTYGAIAREIVGDRATVTSIAQGDEDPHFVQPKPSFVAVLRDADMFVTTGMDLELWVAPLLDRAGNRKVSEGGPGYVTAFTGIHLLEVPTSLSRSQGDIHVDGNPHIHTDPLNGIIIARNILGGLKRISPDNADYFAGREQDFEKRVLEATMGQELVGILTPATAYSLLESDKLLDFLGTQKYQGKPLADRLGGWLKQGQVFRGKEMACYHKEWAYFSHRFQVTCAEYIEAKPGIPPTPGHVQDVIALMRERKIPVLFASNYFDRNQIRQVAERTGARAVIVPENTGGAPGVNTYFDLLNTWVSGLAAGFGGGAS